MNVCEYIQFSNKLEQHRKYRRINGIEKPLHYQQILVWVMLLEFALISFLILIPTLHTSIQPLTYGVISSLYFIHIVSHIVAVIIDPCDPNLLNVSKNVVVPLFDRNKFNHVIENGYCNLCNIYIINNKTKHCSICNKCVENFDHHCKWLNHCIGARNYNGFIVCILSALFTCLIILFICIIELFLYFYKPTRLNLNSWTHSSKWIHVYHNNGNYNSTGFDFDSFLYNTPMNDQIFLCIIFIQTIITLVITMLLLHLSIFHCYISYLGLTTYEYIKKFKCNQEYTLQQRNNLHESINTINNTMYQNSIPVEQNIFVYYACYLCIYYKNRKQELLPTTHKNEQQISTWNKFKTLFNKNKTNVNGNQLTIETIENTFNQIELQNKQKLLQKNKQQKINYICKEKFLQKQAKYNNANNKNNTFCFCLTKYYYPNYNKKNIRKVIKSCKGCKYCRNNKNNSNTSNKLLNKNNLNLQFWKKNKKIVNRNIEYPNVRNIQCSPNIRRNQVKPTTPNETAVFIPLKSPSDDESKNNTTTTLPNLPPPNRKLQNVSLKDISDAITNASKQNGGNNANLKLQQQSQRKNSTISQLKSTKEPNLSPIHESGLSNPSTPYLKKIKNPNSTQNSWIATDSPLASRK